MNNFDLVKQNHYKKEEQGNRKPFISYRQAWTCRGCASLKRDPRAHLETEWNEKNKENVNNDEIKETV